MAQTRPGGAATIAPSRSAADSLGETRVLVGDLENRRAELEERSRPRQTPVLELPTGRPRAETTDIARHAAIRGAGTARSIPAAKPTPAVGTAKAGNDEQGPRGLDQ